MRSTLLATVLLIAVLIGRPARAEDDELERAIAAMRNVPRPENMSAEERKSAGDRLTKAWLTVEAREEAGTARLKEEIEKVREGGEEDERSADEEIQPGPVPGPRVPCAKPVPLGFARRGREGQLWGVSHR